MTRLSEILDQMTTVLNDLKTVMDAEQQQLSVGQINGSQLQRITEEKARCWRRWIIWNNSAVWSRTRSVAQTMTLQSAGRRLPKNAASSRPQPAQRLAAGRQIERNQQALEVLKPHQSRPCTGLTVRLPSLTAAVKISI